MFTSRLKNNHRGFAWIHDEREMLRKPRNKRYLLSNINFVNIQKSACLMVSLKENDWLCLYVISFVTALFHHKSGTGWNCGICTKAVSTWIVHQVRSVIFFPKIEWLTHTLKWLCCLQRATNTDFYPVRPCLSAGQLFMCRLLSTECPRAATLTIRPYTLRASCTPTAESRRLMLR